jgi:hypothetical protein
MSCLLFCVYVSCARTNKASRSPSSLVRCKEPEYLVNAGLPRTGTTALHAAAVAIGLPSVHVWNDVLYPTSPSWLAPFDVSMPRWNGFLHGDVNGSSLDPRYVLLGDAPFFMDSGAIAQRFPLTKILCTTRDVEDWVNSMVRFPWLPGTLYFAHRYGLQHHIDWRGKRRPPVYSNRSESREALRDAFRAHHKAECLNATTLDLRMPPAELWRLFCAIVPARFYDRCTEHVTKPWPHWKGRLQTTSPPSFSSDCHSHTHSHG